MHGGRFYYICQGKSLADKVDCQHGTGQRQICRLPVHAAYTRIKAAGMLTLRELKNMAETAPSGQKTPTARELRSSGKLIAERKIGESAGTGFSGGSAWKWKAGGL